MILNLIGLPAYDLEAVIKFQYESFVKVRVENNLLDTIALTDFIDASFEIDLALGVDNWLDLVLANALVLVPHGEHSLVINGKL